MTLVNIITEDRVPRNPFWYENRMFTNKVNAARFGVREEKGVMTIKRFS